jgi:hypothetical protein
LETPEWCIGYKRTEYNRSTVLEALEALSCFDAWSWIDTFWKLSKQMDYAIEVSKKSLAQLFATSTRKLLAMELVMVPFFDLLGVEMQSHWWEVTSN